MNVTEKQLIDKLCFFLKIATPPVTVVYYLANERELTELVLDEAVKKPPEKYPIETVSGFSFRYSCLAFYLFLIRFVQARTISITSNKLLPINHK